jgi:hypothetical protein
MSLNSRDTVLSLAVTNYSYNKKNHKPSIVVRMGNTKLKKGADYTVKYANNRKVGIATVAVIGKGNYDGTIRKTFTITPGKVKVLKKKTYRRKGNLTEIDLRLSQKYGDKADKYMIRIFVGKRIKSTNLVKYKKNFVVQSKLKKNRRYRIEVYAVKGRLKGPVTALTVTGKSS